MVPSSANDESAIDPPIRVVVAGPRGRMGRIMMEGLPLQPGIALIGGLSRSDSSSPDRLLSGADVLVDFTHPDSAPALLLHAIHAGVRLVSGTSGLNDETLSAIDNAAREQKIGAVWAPNFRLGAALMAHFARIAATFVDSVEIIEAHHATKADAPSGTALALATALRGGRDGDFTDAPVETETLPGVRGGVRDGVRVHSLRLPGTVGWHEVVLATADDILTIRHEDFGREAYVPNVAAAIRAVVLPETIGLVRGYGSLIGLDG